MRLTPQQRSQAISVTVKGIPALAHVTHFERVPAAPNPRLAPSDLDAWGYLDMEYEIYDIKGYRAEWLERKMDRDAQERVEEEILTVMK